ncbi:hypothetical protein PRK78_002284 [Emydomyces testavorans]|uniref:Uncharacterized protein n=1 Tax=Emydomyces testavorans TaxID=2070801 RepID=A0AAF0DE12_9EURO|nr:hypothetical protein PRK78_002284 [Emydomyces testavorans]
MKCSIYAVLLLATVLVAHARPDCQVRKPPQNSTIDETKFIEALKVICPKSAKDPCVDAPQTKGQCRTASQAAGPILRSFERYGIADKNEMAALVSLMALESVEFTYQRNIYPGRPGQGTRNMQLADWNARYAASIPELKQQLDKGCLDRDKILDLLLSKDEYDFGSAAWYLTSQCSAEVRSGLQSGTQDGWEKYITGCVETKVSDERLQYWQKAMDEMKKV